MLLGGSTAEVLGQSVPLREDDRDRRLRALEARRSLLALDRLEEVDVPGGPASAGVHEEEERAVVLEEGRLGREPVALPDLVHELRGHLGDLELEDLAARAFAELDRVLVDARGARSPGPGALLEALGVAEEIAEALGAREAVVGESRVLPASSPEVVHERAEERRLPGAHEPENSDLHGRPPPSSERSQVSGSETFLGR